jgi:hypothetical protein
MPECNICGMRYRIGMVDDRQLNEHFEKCYNRYLDRLVAYRALPWFTRLFTKRPRKKDGKQYPPLSDFWPTKKHNI